nr:phospholipase-like, aminotransferase-like mobile domain protein [Tanacetum cinerariifolium]
MIHYVLQKQSFADDESFDLPLVYHLNGHSLHYESRQFYLVTGFKFGLISLPEHRNGDILFHNRLFPKKIGYDVKIIDVLAFIEDERSFRSFGVDVVEDFKEYTLRDYYCWLKTYCCWYKLKPLNKAAGSRLRLLEENDVADEKMKKLL